MSRMDTHPSDLGYSPYDTRDFQIHHQSHGPGLRDPSRDFWQRADSSREYPLREPPGPPSYYHAPSPTVPSFGPGDGGRTGSGYGGSRTFAGNGGQGIGAAAAGDTGVHTVTPNSGRQTAGGMPPSQVQPSFALNHHHRPSSGSVFPSSPAAPYSERDRDRDLYITPRPIQQQASPTALPQHAPPPPLASPNSLSSQRSTLWWGELEPWMDEEYAKQVCNIMGWDPVNIKVPRPAPDHLTGRQANNPGYCFLTFPSQPHAASVLAQVNNSAPGSLTMPNSSKPFTLNWASSIPTAPLATPFTTSATISIPGAQNPQYPKEYSIFVGDLAPEVSNSDLVAVFRNPVLGLRNDREPRFIRPFLSCKSAKIMLDPVTGVSRGYGFVRFTDELDQQRALVEMHGLYCLSRPMRISPATAKFKPVPGMAGVDLAQMGYSSALPMNQIPEQPVTIALPLPNTSQTKSVSAPLAGPSASGSNNSIGSANAASHSLSVPSLSSNSSTASSATLVSAPSDDVLKNSQGANGNNAPASSGGVPSSISAGLAQQTQDQLMAQKYNIPEESWKHHAQARAILSNLIGPNGEQLTSSDPYNTTVFVGGLSPLISEETLRTFFAPFGDIHYVKVPVGKHCGFVQFVRKPDAERAIEKMQGFPIGGSRIRLSWGRSQYKAAQAAAQAAQAAAFQAQYQAQMASQNPAPLTTEQAVQLLEKFGISPYLTTAAPDDMMGSPTDQVNSVLGSSRYEGYGAELDPRQNGSFSASSFSPFSPDPNYLFEAAKERESAQSRSQSFIATSKAYAPWFNNGQQEKMTSGSHDQAAASSSQTARPPSSQRFSSFMNDASHSSPFSSSRTASRQEAPIARPDLSRRATQVSSQDHGSNQEHESIHDLNGTLASLDLDHTQGMWKAGAEAQGSRAMPSSP